GVVNTAGGPSAGSAGTQVSFGGTAGTSAGTAGALESGGGCGVHPPCPDNLHCVAGECSECSTDADCNTAMLPRCDENNRCVACLSDSDCETGFTCDPLMNHCLQRCKVKA